MPATHLISVDLPAPLSPTRAITWPGNARKSTSSSARTIPKCFETPRSSRVGLSVGGAIEVGNEGRPAGRPSNPITPQLLAVLLVRAATDVAPLQVAVLDRLVPVLLRNRERRLECRRHLPHAVARLAVDAHGLAALDQRDRELGGRVRLERDRLVDGDALPAGDDVLDPL